MLATATAVPLKLDNCSHWKIKNSISHNLPSESLLPSTIFKTITLDKIRSFPLKIFQQVY